MVYLEQMRSAKFISFILIIIIFFIAPVLVLAQNNLKSSDIVVLPKSETIQTDYYAAGESVNLEGTVKGDAYLAGGIINVDGNINGDLLAAGGNLNIRGNISQDIRVAGGNIYISGTVGGNITTVGGSITIAESAKVAGTLTAAGGNVIVNAPLPKDIHAGAGNLALANSVGGNVNAGVGALSLSSRSSISGDLNYWSEEQASISREATISGAVNRHLPQKDWQKSIDAEKKAKQGIGAIVTGFKFYTFLTGLLIGLLLLKLAPELSRKIANIINLKPWASLGIGFLTIIVVPVAFILLLITVIGVPLAFLLLGIFLITTSLVNIFVALFIGQKTLTYFNKKTNIYLQFLTGAIIFFLVGLVPFIGALMGTLAFLVGLGALLLTKKTIYQDLRQKKFL